MWSDCGSADSEALADGRYSSGDHLTELLDEAPDHRDTVMVPQPVVDGFRPLTRF